MNNKGDDDDDDGGDSDIDGESCEENHNDKTINNSYDGTEEDLENYLDTDSIDKSKLVKGSQYLSTVHQMGKKCTCREHQHKCNIQAPNGQTKSEANHQPNEEESLK